MRRAPSLLLVLLMTLGPLGLLQSLAWSGMLVRELGAGHTDAVARAFGGDHPCSLCTAVAEQRAEEGRGEDSDERRWRIEVLPLAAAEVPRSMPRPWRLPPTCDSERPPQRSPHPEPRPPSLG